MPEPDWYIKQQKDTMIKNCDDLITRCKRFMLLNVCVGMWDVVWAFLILPEKGTIMLFLKILIFGLGIMMFWLSYRNYKIIQITKILKSKLETVKCLDGEWFMNGERMQS